MADRIVNTKSKIREITGVVLNTDDKIGRPYRVIMVDQFGPFFEYHSAESFLQLVAEEIAAGRKMKFVEVA